MLSLYYYFCDKRYPPEARVPREADFHLAACTSTNNSISARRAINNGKPCSLQALSVGLEQSHDFLLSKHAHILGPGNSSTLRLLYYPPVGAPEPGVTRCGVHSDYGTFTLLAQVCRLRYCVRTRGLQNLTCSKRFTVVNKFLRRLRSARDVQNVINSVYLYIFPIAVKYTNILLRTFIRVSSSFFAIKWLHRCQLK